MNDADLREYFTSEDPHAEARKEFWGWLAKETAKREIEGKITSQERKEMLTKAYDAKTMGELLVFADQLGLTEGDFREHLRETRYATKVEKGRDKRL